MKLKKQITLIALCAWLFIGYMAAQEVKPLGVITIMLVTGCLFTWCLLFIWQPGRLE